MKSNHLHLSIIFHITKITDRIPVVEENKFILLLFVVCFWFLIKILK